MIATLSGCKSWVDRSTTTHQATKREKGTLSTKVRKSRTSFVLNAQFVTVQIDSRKPDDAQSMWQWIDETVLPIQNRQALLENGIRIGRVSQTDRFETTLRALSDSESDDEVDVFLKSAAVANDHPVGDDSIPIQFGKRYELPVRLPLEGMVTAMVNLDGQVIGETLEDPQYLFALMASRGNGTREVALKIRPEIQHGQTLLRWKGSDSAMRIDSRRDAWSLKELEFYLTCAEGESYVISETLPRRGLGQAMFGGENVDRAEQQVILILSVSDIPQPSDAI